MKDKGCCPWLSVITGGESLVSRAGEVLLVEAARRSGLAKELTIRLRVWRRCPQIQPRDRAWVAEVTHLVGLGA